jgi:hypothetical protein
MPQNEVVVVQVRHIADLVCLFIFSSFYILISSSFYAFHLDWFFHLSSVCFSSIFFLRDPSISSPRFGTTAQMVELIGAGRMAGRCYVPIWSVPMGLPHTPRAPRVLTGPQPTSGRPFFSFSFLFFLLFVFFKNFLKSEHLSKIKNSN